MGLGDRGKLSRRGVLVAGGAVLALPWLRHLTPRAVAQSSAKSPLLTEGGFPKRVIILFKPGGMWEPKWFPSKGKSATEFILNEHTQPLAPMRQKLLFVDGIDNLVMTVGPGESHAKGAGSVLTGWELNEGTRPGLNQEKSGFTKGPSFDQLIAQRIGSQTPIGSLQAGIRTSSGNALSKTIIYAGNEQPVFAQDDPTVIFEQVFKGRQLPAAEREAARAKRVSVLDFVREELRAVTKQASVEDRPRLEAHATFVRELEARVASEEVRECAVPATPAELDPANEQLLPRLFDLQADLVVHALACDLTRVATLQISNGANPLSFPFLPSPASGVGDHKVGHFERRNQENEQAKRAVRYIWYMERLNALLTKLDSYPEGEGTLLDHSLVLFCSENSNGQHGSKRHPFVIAGGLGGHFKRGQLLHFTGASHSDMLASFLDAFGIESTKFGNPAFRSGLLDALRA